MIIEVPTEIFEKLESGNRAVIDREIGRGPKEVKVKKDEKIISCLAQNVSKGKLRLTSN